MSHLPAERSAIRPAFRKWARQISCSGFFRSHGMKLHHSYDSLASANLPRERPACELNVFYHRIDELATKGTGRPSFGHFMAHEIGCTFLLASSFGRGINASECPPPTCNASPWSSPGLLQRSMQQAAAGSSSRSASPAQEDLMQANLIPR